MKLYRSSPGPSEPAPAASSAPQRASAPDTAEPQPSNVVHLGPRLNIIPSPEAIERGLFRHSLKPTIAAAPAEPGGLIGGLVAAPVAVAGAAVGTAASVAGGVTGGLLGIAPPPQGMTTAAQKAEILSQLTAMPPGPQYDATFVAASLQGHQEALAIHGSYAQSGEDPGLRRIVRGTLPLIHLHISPRCRAGRSASRADHSR